MFSRLLVGVDGSASSATALATVLELARRFESTVVLASVSDLRAIQAPMLTGGPLLAGDLPAALPVMNSLGEALAERAEKLLAEAASKVRAAGLTAETVQASGLVTDMLLSLAEEAEALVVGRQGGTHTGTALGSETTRIIRRSTRPVLVAGASLSLCRRPVVAYDGGETSGNALTLAARYTLAAGSQLNVVHVADEVSPGEELLARAGAYLSGLGVEFTTRLVNGPVVDAVARHVEAGAYDLLLVGAHGGKRRRTWSIGSHAEKLVRATSIPSIVVR